MIFKNLSNRAATWLPAVGLLIPVARIRWWWWWLRYSISSAVDICIPAPGCPQWVRTIGNTQKIYHNLPQSGRSVKVLIPLIFMRLKIIFIEQSIPKGYTMWKYAKIYHNLPQCGRSMKVSFDYVKISLIFMRWKFF